MCNYQGYFSYTAADAICKEMNFARAERWTTDGHFEIQTNYRNSLTYVWCKKAEWESCSYSYRVGYSPGCSPNSGNRVFLSCTSKCFELLQSLDH